MVNMERPIYINGRFLSARLTGVQRVALEMIKGLDRQLDQLKSAGLPYLNVEILHPPGAVAIPNLQVIGARQVGARRGQAWEQLDLLRASKDGTLLSLCNGAPLLKRDAITMLHDAQVYTAPKSYGLGFRIWYKFAHPVIGRLHRRIVTVSQYSLNELVSLHVVNRQKISCIPNGCDHVLESDTDEDAVSKFGLAPGTYTVSLSNTLPHKNIAVLLRAFADPQLSGHTLALFGSATAADFTANGEQIPPNVRFLGRVSDEELKGLLQSATCFACPSLTEGFGLMPLEAMALGCPAIIAPCGALPEVCGDAALLADPYRPKDWASQITMLVEDREMAATYARKGKDRAALFSWDRSAKALLDLLMDRRADRSSQ
jgi:glycosyltransferase involved in cell wall biosynthesis